MNCPNCGVVINETADQCQACGTQLRCANCGESIRLEASFCTKCGTKTFGRQPATIQDSLCETKQHNTPGAKREPTSGYILNGLNDWPLLFDILCKLTVFQKLGLLGAGVLFVGVFCPLMRVNIFLSFYRLGQGHEVVILILALYSGVKIINRQYWWSFLTGTTSLLVLSDLYFCVRSVWVDTSDDPYGWFGDLQSAIHRTQPEPFSNGDLAWGYYLMMIAALLIVIASLQLLRNRKT